MSLPPGFLDELRTRTSLSQVVGRKVMWDQRKSNQGRGDMWAPCPFHQEKTASFHVDDQKGFYYCFGCHAKGDAISFIRETENMGFMEAVELLAREVGMSMPARDPKAQEKADRRGQLADVMEQAVQFYRLQLRTGAAAAARDYLAGRGLGEAALERWEIGFAPEARRACTEHLTGKGVPLDLVVAAGLAAHPDGGGEAYDRFRGRIVFPIRDARGRAIALGGRAMDPNARAKYLNSPETELFDKGRSLYNHGPARAAAGKGKTLLVAEGYMDVIALAEAGFAAAVAPLGTAITVDQLNLIWRIAPEPVIALDGDTAGLRAAMRLIDIALPLLEPGRSLRFCLMPPGQDPDDVIRAGGAPAMQKLLDRAQPMVALLWRRETEGKSFDSPERRAALDKSLREAIRKIADASVRAHYGDEIKRLRGALFGGPPAPPRGQGARAWTRTPSGPTPGAKQSFLAASADAAGDRLREAVILAVILRHPTLLPVFEDALESLECHGADHQLLRQALLQNRNATPDELCGKVFETAGEDLVEKLLAQSHIRVIPAIRNGEDTEQAKLCVAEELAKLSARRGAERELTEAMQDIGSLVDEGLTWRLGQAAEARARADQGQGDDEVEYEVGPNGARIRREERDAFADLLAKIEFAKHGRRPH